MEFPIEIRIATTSQHGIGVFAARPDASDLRSLHFCPQKGTEVRPLHNPVDRRELERLYL
jgi:hypothetical protein